MWGFYKHRDTREETWGSNGFKKGEGDKGQKIK